MRDSMKDERLTSLAFFLIETDVLDQLDFDNVIETLTNTKHEVFFREKNTSKSVEKQLCHGFYASRLIFL